MDKKKCPKCGKGYIKVSIYSKEKSRLYIHKKELIKIGILPAYYRITESCHVKNNREG